MQGSQAQGTGDLGDHRIRRVLVREPQVNARHENEQQSELRGLLSHSVNDGVIRPAQHRLRLSVP